MAINKKTKTNKTQSTKNAEQITEVNKIPFDHFVSEYYPKLFEAEYPLSYSDLQSNNLTGKGVSSLLDRINKALSVATSQNPSPYIRALNLAKSGELPNPDEVQELNESSLLPVVLSLKTNPAELNRKILKDLEDLPQRAKKCF
ncbi:MAG: hypothetical protein CV045_02785 [Cyanobacteria bacterium M5B4]|nr:MAG: hypothetical protein CV045_02785 [Cyanobacteria bacterium M5B4]